MDYIAYLHKDRDSDFGVSFPDFPGCITAGKNLEEARKNAVAALSLHIAGMVEDGEKIPVPSTIDDIAEDPNIKNAVAFLVSANLERTVRFNVTARESQLESINRRAQSVGMSRSAYMVHASIAAKATTTRQPHLAEVQKKSRKDSAIAVHRHKTRHRP